MEWKCPASAGLASSTQWMSWHTQPMCVDWVGSAVGSIFTQTQDTRKEQATEPLPENLTQMFASKFIWCGYLILTQLLGHQLNVWPIQTLWEPCQTDVHSVSYSFHVTVPNVPTTTNQSSHDCKWYIKVQRCLCTLTSHLQSCGDQLVVVASVKVVQMWSTDQWFHWRIWRKCFGTIGRFSCLTCWGLRK
jgi:hypothetical protein